MCPKSTGTVEFEAFRISHDRGCLNVLVLMKASVIFLDIEGEGSSRRNGKYAYGTRGIPLSVCRLVVAEVLPYRVTGL